MEIISDFIIQSRKNALFLSPTEIEFICQWEQLKIPVNIVLSVLVDLGKSLPIRINQRLHLKVIKASARYQPKTGSPQALEAGKDRPSKDFIANRGSSICQKTDQFCQQLTEWIQQESDELIQTAYLKIRSQISDIRSQPLEEIDQKLLSFLSLINYHVSQALFLSLPKGQKKEMMAEIRPLLTFKKKRLGKEALLAQYLTQLDDRIRRRYCLRILK